MRIETVESDDSLHWKQKQVLKEQIQRTVDQLSQKELEWAPPAHHHPRFCTPIPAAYFQNAIEYVKKPRHNQKWCLWTNGDLIRNEQMDLLQDAMSPNDP